MLEMIVKLNIHLNIKYLFCGKLRILLAEALRWEIGLNFPSIYFSRHLMIGEHVALCARSNIG